MRLVTPRPRPQTPADCRRAVALIRTDISGTALVRHSDMVTAFCKAHDITLLQTVDVDGAERAHPVGLVLLAIGGNGADAVIIPHADHLGEGLRVVAARALVISLEQDCLWLRNGEAVEIR